ncbi:MAG: hypothetical protein NT145_03635 [Elusimicrobia bacterium]|nr:hypothetical protein [Elusimicrobiota bacterium]
MKTKKRILRLIGLGFTIGGLIIAIKGDLTDGLLMMILGELVDLEYRFNKL